MRLQTLCMFVSFFISFCQSFGPSPNPAPSHRLKNFCLHDIARYKKPCKNPSMLAYCILLTNFLIVTFSVLGYKLMMHVRFICFHTPLNMASKRSQISKMDLSKLIITIPITITLLELELHQIWAVMFIFIPDIIIPKVRRKWCTFPKKLLFWIVVLQLFAASTSQISHLLCLAVLLLSCYSVIGCLPTWVIALVLILSNDIETQPGPISKHENYFSFMCWNLNSLAKDDFSRTKLIEAHNSIYDYDIISLCETCLTDDLVKKVPDLEGYKFEPANHPDDLTRGGVGIYYKTSLPLIVRRDLSFDESLVVELKFKRKKIFFTVLYRSPSFNHCSAEFQKFLGNFKDLHSKLRDEKPYASFYTGDFNAHSNLWWPDGDTNKEGSEIEELLNTLNLSQVMKEPTNFTPHCNPSCIDLIVTDQPNVILNSGTRLSLDPKCHHQIIHCKINVRIPPIPPSERRTWNYQRANINAIQRSLFNFPWEQQLSLNTDVDWQVKTFNETVLNIMTNFIPNEVKRFTPRDPPWIDKTLKSKLNKKNRLFKNYKRHGYRSEDKVRIEAFRIECTAAIEKAKSDYLNNLGKKLNDTNTPRNSQK